MPVTLTCRLSFTLLVLQELTDASVRFSPSPQCLVHFVGGWESSCVFCGLVLGWGFLFLCFSFFVLVLKENLKDLFLFRDVIQQHCVKLFHKWVRILPSFFSRRKRPCGKACGKCGSSENVHYVTQQGTETQGAVEKPAEWAVQWAVRVSYCIFRGSKFCVLPLLPNKAATVSDSKPKGILTNPQATTEKVTLAKHEKYKIILNILH